MPIQQLSLAGLSLLDLGKTEAALAQHLRRVARDCYDRPGDRKARKVSLEIAVTPVLDADGGCELVKVQVQVTSAVPKMRTREYEMRLRPNGSISFNEDLPTDFDQSTLFEGLAGTAQSGLPAPGPDAPGDGD